MRTLLASAVLAANLSLAGNALAQTDNNWPVGVVPIGIDDLGRLGINPENDRLYWDGREVQVTYGLRKLELWLAIAGVAAAWTTALASIAIARKTGRSTS